LGFIYKHEKFTANAEADVMNFEQFKVGAVAGQGPVSGGLSACINKGTGVESVDVALGYKFSNFFGVLRSSKFFAAHSLLATYCLNDKMKFAAQVNHVTDTTCCGAVVYKCNDNTTVKVKADCCGNVNASVKQILAKSFSVVGAVQVPLNSKDSGFKWAINATLG